MRNFKTFMVLFAVMASLTTAFGALMYHAFTASMKEYGIQPGDLRTFIVVMAIFATCAGFSAYLLGKAIDWLGWYKQFQKTFGFRPADRPEDRTPADYRLVETNLHSIRHLHSREKWVKAALLAERFGFLVQWPPELQAEYTRTHR